MSSAANRPPQAISQSVGQFSSQSASQSISSPSSMSASVQPSGQLSGPSATQSSSQSDVKSSGKTLRKPPSRPQLMGPPARPKPPTPPVEKAKPAPPPEPEAPPEPQPLGPIPIPSERMQYRAIGLIKGRYIASEEQFNRGDIALEDGTLIDAVLLGRVTSLIKKHVDLETPHLWVVYPRTLYKEENEPALHMQIVGIWEPETLSAKKAEQDEEEGPGILSSEAAEEKHCDRFSIRGEVAKYSEEDSEIVINIVQKSKSESAKPKRPFKLLVKGTLNGRTTGYFWDLEVEREGGLLVLKSAKSIAVVPPKKKSKDDRKRGGPRRSPAASKPRTTPVPKPKPKAKSSDNEKSPEKISSEQQAPVEKASVEKPPVEKATVENSIEKAPAKAAPEAESVDTAPDVATTADTVTPTESVVESNTDS
ncbi:MAG: hypothetical protein AAF171_24450 [Cyanobacteria bacterium P01_A01_bin.116]